MENVILATPIYPPDVGGAATYFSQIVEILKESNEYEPLVVANANKRERVVFDEDGMPIVRVCKDNPSPAHDVISPLKFIETEIGVTPDLIHLHPNLKGIDSLLSGFNPQDIPVVYDCRGPDYSVDNLNTKKIGAYATVFMSITEDVDKALIEKAGVSPDNIFRSPVIIHTSHIGERQSSEPGGFRAVFVSRLHPHKGVDIAVQAIRNLSRETDIELVIVGDGYHEDIARDASDAHEYIEYMGRLGHSETLAEIKAADVLLAPSAIETGEGPRTVLEALELGTPVVATDRAKIAENIGSAGLISPKKVDTFVESIEVMMDDYEFYKKEAEYISPLDYSKDDLKKNIIEAYWKALIDSS